jgi:N-acetylmuramoyl-L-alanine amidase
MSSTQRAAMSMRLPRRAALSLVVLTPVGLIPAAVALAQAAPGATAASRAFRVVVDAGHGGRDPGASSKSTTMVEKDVTLKVALLTGAALQRLGVGVVYTRTDDRYVPLADRAALAASSAATLLLSVHVNSVSDASIGGAEAWYGRGTRGADLARVTLAGLTPALREYRLDVRGVRSGAGLAVLRTAVPATLVELGYLSNAREAALLAQPAFLGRLAEGLAAGVVRFRDTTGGATAPAIPKTSGSSGTSVPASATATPRQSTTAATRRHRVQPGETLSEIAQRYDVSLAALLAANPARDPNRVVVGTMLVIPD